MKPILIAHRGDTVHFPENTLDAFQSAFDLGADGVELDVHLNKSGEIIVVHNYLHDESKDYLKLENVFEKFAKRGRLEVEVKSFDILCLEKLKNLLEKYNPIDYEITSSILPLLSYIRDIIPSARLGMIFKSYHFEEWMTEDFISKTLLGYMKLAKCDVLHLDLEKYNSKIVSLVHDNKYLVHTHLKTDSFEDYKNAVGLGIDQCSIDDISLLKKI